MLNRQFTVVGLDFVHLDPCGGGCEYLLVISNHFSGFTKAEAYSEPNQTSKVERFAKIVKNF